MLKLAALFLSLLPLCAADLTGVWSPASREQFPLHVELRQSGGSLSGSCGLRADFLWPLISPKLSGNRITFAVQMQSAPLMRFEGEVDRERIIGKIAAPGPQPGREVELKRTGPPARLPAAFSKNDLAPLGDEFDHPATLKNWKNFSAVGNLPNRIEKIDVHQTNPGNLTIVPLSAAWWAGYHGVYLFKEVEGDFVITTRLKVTGKNGGEPATVWTLSGLLVRAAGADENWVYLMTGRGPAEARVVDAKSTINGQNVWDITPAGPGWYELRIVRLGPVFVLLARPDGGAWTIRKRIFRPDLPRTLQAGINVTSDVPFSATMPPAKYNAGLFPGQGRPDSLTLFDYVRYSGLPGGAEKAVGGREFDAVSDSDLLALLN